MTLYSRLNPGLSEAQQSVPAAFLSPALTLQAPKDVKSAPPESGDETVVESEHERPKGRMLLYWGCGPAVRSGQPKVLDMASASAADLAKFFVARRATQRGTHSASGRPVWPSQADARGVPANASLVGEHTFSGSGVPEGFRFRIPAAQDLMPPLQVQQVDQGGATNLTWTGLPTARAYFIAGMGAAKQDEMVIWSSSELPETGFGLIEYQTNSAVDRWLGEKVLLAPATTQCAVPKDVFPGGAAMLRVIAYGSELNLAQPPRPADPKAPWEPVWAAKIRVKSVANVMLGMPTMGEAAAPAGESESAAGSGGEEAQAAGPAEGNLRPMKGTASRRNARRSPSKADALGGNDQALWRGRWPYRPAAARSARALWLRPGLSALNFAGAKLACAQVGWAASRPLALQASRCTQRWPPCQCAPR